MKGREINIYAKGSPMLTIEGEESFDFSFSVFIKKT